MSSRFMYVVAPIRISFFLEAGQHSIVCTYHIYLSIQLLIDIWVVSTFLAVVNNAIMYTGVGEQNSW